MVAEGPLAQAPVQPLAPVPRASPSYGPIPRAPAGRANLTGRVDTLAKPSGAAYRNLVMEVSKVAARRP